MMNDAAGATLDNPARRRFLGTGGALVIAFSSWPALGYAAGERSDDAGPWPKVVDPHRLDSWLAITADGRVCASVGKIECGMGISTAFTQIVADELDVPLQSVVLVMGDTANTVNQRGTGGSNGIIEGGPALRTAGAEARHALLAMAAQRFAVAPEQLRVNDGVISVDGAPQRRVTYAELVGGKHFDLVISGKVKPKPASQYKLVGRPVPRADIAEKMTAQYRYLVDLKYPGMVHARIIRPPQAGAKLLDVPAGQSFPGLIQIVTRGDFVAVVCEREEQALRASRALKLNWSKPAPMFDPSYDALYETLWTVAPFQSQVEPGNGDVDAAMASAARTLDVRYDYPFQSHASLGPGCAVADVRPDHAEVWAGGQKPYPLRKAIALWLKMPVEQVRVTWLPGPGSYGMNDADDAAMDAVILSQTVGRPVRVQYMRIDAVGWDPKGSPTSYRMRGGLDAHGEVVAFDYQARGYSSLMRPSGTDTPGDTLSVQLIGNAQGSGSYAFQFSDETYRFANKRKASHLLDWKRSLITGLRTSHLRDPDGMSCCFASECFIDELAAAAKADPVEFRLRYLTDPRHRGVVQAVAEKAGWQTRPSPKPPQAGPIVTGRGIAYAPRGHTAVALVAEVEVNRETGHFRVTRFVVAHDCGYVINPLNLHCTIEANLMMAMSRAKYEAVRFDAERVTSVDWLSYPIADINDVPDAVEIVLVNNDPGQKSSGAGEPASRPMAAVLANALFDATGVRLRRVPFTPESLLAALGNHAKATA